MGLGQMGLVVYISLVSARSSPLLCLFTWHAGHPKGPPKAGTKGQPNPTPPKHNMSTHLCQPDFVALGFWVAPPVRR